ncbi:MAG: hypothetical protein JST92_12665, partial [Deltaproteobacteria bacterium]|nr:hypothetical protein [Deltaproteobacteria bacterium]
VNSGKTQTGMVMGTPAYMSPEQGSGETSKIDGRSDIYSLGVMMYQMAVGKLPFPGQNFGEVLMGHLQKTPPPPRGIVPDIPEDYEAIILRTLEKRQEDRFQSMNELRDAIFGCLQAHGISAESPLADETEELSPVSSGSPSNPGARTPSRPGRTNPPKSGTGQGLRASNPGRQGSQPGRQASQPGRSPSMSGRSAPPGELTQMEGPKSNLGLIIGIAVGVLVLAGGGITYAVISSNNEAEAARLLAEKEKREAQRAKERAEAEAEPPVYLAVVSDPSGAHVEATWKGGNRSDNTPFQIELPKNTKVHFEFAKDGYSATIIDAIADSAQTVNATLKAVKVAQADPKPEGEAPAEPKKSRRAAKKEEKATTKDGLINADDVFGK